MKAVVSWGTESEFETHEALTGLTDELQAEYGEARVGRIILPGQKHALANDVHLQAAIVRQGLTA